MIFTNKIFIYLTFAWVLFLLSCSPNAQVIKPTKELILIAEYDIQVPEPSGLSLGKNSESLWTVSDTPDNCVYQMDLKGNIINKLNYFGDDFEGIEYDSIKNVLWIAEERKRQIIELSITGKKLSSKKINFKGKGNKGFEGISLCNSNFYIANEKQPVKLLKLDSNFNSISSFDIKDIKDISGICCDNTKNRIWGISDESKLLFCYDENLGITEKYELPFDKMEGLAIDLKRNLVYLVNDYRQKLFIYKIEEYKD